MYYTEYTGIVAPRIVAPKLANELEQIECGYYIIPVLGLSP